MKKHSFGSRLFLGLVLLVLYLPIVVVVIYSFNDNSARIPLAFTGWTTRWYGELLDGKGGYGLRNVEQRLRLYYGCGLMIESEYRHGTRISFTVPDEQEGKTL